MLQEAGKAGAFGTAGSPEAEKKEREMLESYGKLLGVKTADLPTKADLVDHKQKMKSEIKNFAVDLAADPMAALQKQAMAGLTVTQDALDKTLNTFGKAIDNLEKEVNKLSKAKSTPIIIKTSLNVDGNVLAATVDKVNQSEAKNTD